ncbi:uncharacterized protein BJ171DRAFT_465975 [Polychytrium aggregatum]|uniref:uncharacterized protein n=1 Tax=Polychytrium aggregatum TaxID=110093 RepID=UPI0022FF3BCD|nr:uncharacterized protein BJ171DRAFT_465975 [Polychytrium aggregatum]KAI9193223.1 hypothetical protein BJ171DRAFT_465975 [Polychytrium aggregatum]
MSKRMHFAAVCVLGALLLAPQLGVQAQTPPTSPSDVSRQEMLAYVDPILYYSLLEWRNCPQYPNNNDCQYYGTPQKPSAQYGNITWNCDAGSYCLSSNRTAPCTHGFYCPANAAEPVYCPPGYYCPDPSNIIECPQGSFCPAGTTRPISCDFMAYCPPRSQSAFRFGVLFIFLIFCIILYVAFSFKEQNDRKRFLKHRIQIGSVNQTDRKESAALGKLSKTFDVEFENLGLVLPNGVEIMKGVSGALRGGRTCAIMGPSGAGKTTFVTLLTGKVKRTSGSVKVNGRGEELSKYKKLIGYVPQEDVMLRELTVRDILMHSARMRLPSSWNSAKIKDKVLEIISFLGLSHVIDSPIGDEQVRGISGGQRKRVNIGMELVAEPSLLFLDEPTSGLDSSTSFELCHMLRRIAQQQGLLVAAVIHSPSPSTFREFDDFMLLGKGGRLIYFGPREECSAYFDSIGFTCPPDESPSDFFMDVASGKVPCALDPNFKTSDLFEYWIRHKEGRKVEPKERSSSEIADSPLMGTEPVKKQSSTLGKIGRAIVEFFSELFWWIGDVALELGMTLLSIGSFIICRSDPIRQTCGLHLQLWYLTKRASLQAYRNFQSIAGEMMMHFGVGCFISIATQKFTYFSQLPNPICFITPPPIYWVCANPTDKIREMGMFLCIGVLFAGIAVGSSTFGREKPVYWRDVSAGMGAVPYFLGKFLVDVPKMIVASLMFSLSFSLLTTIYMNYWNVIMIVSALYFSSYAMGYTLSAAIKPAQVALAGTGFSLLWALVLSGVMPSYSDVISESNSGIYQYIGWLWKISAPRYAVEAFWVREVQNRPFDVDLALPPPYGYVWNAYIPNWFMMIYIGLGWHFLAFLALKAFDRRKMK